MQIKKIAKLLAKIILPMIFIIVSLECLMIVFEPYLFKGFYEYDPDLGFRVRPHSPNADGTQTNQFGFNARDYALQKTPGTLRILVIGDSFNWAGGFEGNYAILLERMFEQRDGSHKIDVINAGYPMTHTGEELAMLKKYGIQYNPDLVVLGFFMGNDFVDADPDRKRIVVNGIYMDISKSRELRVLGYPIVPQSRLYLFLKQKYEVYEESKKAAQESRDQQKPPTFSDDTYLDIERGRLEFFNLSYLSDRRFQPKIDYIFQSISEMNALLKSRNIKLVVAIYPDEFQVNEDLLQSVLDKYKLRRQNYELNPGQNLLAPFLNSQGIPFIDFTDRFRAEGKRQALYQIRDTHWNSAGNHLAAEILFEDLSKRIANANH